VIEILRRDEKHLEGSGHTLATVLSPHLSGESEEEQQRPQSRQPVCLPVFEPSIFRMKLKTILATVLSVII
jgi:hypothetical protein